MARKKSIKPEVLELPLLPLKNVVILPKSVLPIIVGRESSVIAVEYALKKDSKIFITAQKVADTENPTQEDVFESGVIATIVEVRRSQKGTLRILVEGMSRARIISSKYSRGIFKAEVEVMPLNTSATAIELSALWKKLQKVYSQYVKLNPKAPLDLLDHAQSIEDMDIIADNVAINLNLTFEARQKLLELTDLAARLLLLHNYLASEIDIIETDERIESSVNKQIEKSQRDYYLSERIKAIQKELGREDHNTEAQQIREQLKGISLSPEAREKVEKELKRLEQMPPLSAEAVVSRNYIDWIISIPWSKTTEDNISLEEAETILDKKHAGLKKAKERIIEFLAAKKFSKAFQRSPIICLIGAPGVGKTSLAESIAESLGREFVRISLGGIKDEAEIRGHRRTYIGAMPGKIIQAMKKAKTTNPVILLDEIDKMASNINGDPASALLEVLDPEQNKNFVDHYIEAEYDLSKVLFVATANVAEGIPFPLWDRMERITLSGYTEDEKLNIAESFLIPKNLKEYGLKPKQFIIPKEILQKIIAQYTKEAGVRQLERIISKLMRKSIQVLLKDESAKSITLNVDQIKEWLGNPTFKPTSLEISANKIGLATGLAWTEVGGDVLEIEVTVLPGKGGLTLTGQLGEVMQESAHAAMSYIRSRATNLGLKDSFHAAKDIHIHLPEGATPKDGPSAGITICLALVSALKSISIKPSLAMTGEITLRGRVLAIGGLKSKLLAAKQHNISTVLVPEENRDDVEEITKEIGEIPGLEIIFVSHMDEVLKHGLSENPFEVRKAKTAAKKKVATKKANKTSPSAKASGDKIKSKRQTK